jgi:stalled ribosome rescue protein Dom34
LAEYQRLGQGVLAELREMRDRSRAVFGVREVLQAAAAGRVHQLCVRSGTEMVGPMEAALNRANLPSEDLVNAAVVETLRNGGEVYLLPAEQMPVTESACAMLRY